MKSHPVDDVALRPLWHLLYASMLVCPDILLGRDGYMRGQRDQNFGSGARVFGLDIIESSKRCMILRAIGLSKILKCVVCD
jgi:hypothetical protein